MNKRTIAITGSALTMTAIWAVMGPTGIAFAANTPSPMASSSAMMTKGGAGDISFVQMMIPHHQQAVQMASMALANAKSPEVNAMAKQIKAAQAPEIAKMKGWLKAWGAPMSSDSSMPGMDMGSMSPGMMTAT